MVVVPEGASVPLEAVGVAKEYLDNNQGAKVGVRMVVMVVIILMVLMMMLILAVGPTVICYVLILCLEGTAPSALGKPLKKSGLTMEFFRKGSDPPPLFLEVMEPMGHI